MKNKFFMSGVILTALSLNACGSSLTTVGNPRGIKIDVNLTNDVEGSNEAEVMKYLTTSPDGYIVGTRSLSLIKCDDGDDDGDDLCPGEAGVEITNADVNTDEDTDNDIGISTILALTEDDLFIDPLIYDAGSFSFGDSDPIETTTITEEDITEEGDYSGFQLRLDFVAIAAPVMGGDLPLPEVGIEFELVLVCLNNVSCSLTDYSDDYLAPLQEVADNSVSSGDYVFIDTDGANAFWWNFDTGLFVSISEATPDNPLGISLDDLPYDDETGEAIYNAAFGSEEGGVDPISITTALVEDGSELTLSTVFSVDSSMSWDDDDSDETVNSIAEMETFAIGKPRITEFSLTTTE